jgi:hypothetical protein
MKKLTCFLLAIQVVHRAVEIEQGEFLRPGVAHAAERGAELAEAPAVLGEHVAGVAIVEDLRLHLLQHPRIDLGHRGQVAGLPGAQPGALGEQALLLLLVVEQRLAFDAAEPGGEVRG